MRAATFSAMIRRQPRLALSVLIAVTWTAISFRPTMAHEEPPKTSVERTEQAKRRALFASQRVRLQRLRIARPAERSGEFHDMDYVTNRFNETGDLIEQIVHDAANGERSVSVYDGDGTWLEELHYKGTELSERDVHVYGADGLIRSVVVFDSAGSQSEFLRYEYRPETDAILVEKRDRDARALYTIEYDYEPGSGWSRQIQAVQKGADGAIMLRTRNTFEAGRRLTKEVYRADGALSHVFHYFYTPGGDFHEIVQRTATGGPVASRQLFDYEDNGLPLAVTNFDGDGKIVRRLLYSYERFPNP